MSDFIINNLQEFKRIIRETYIKSYIYQSDYDESEDDYVYEKKEQYNIREKFEIIETNPGAKIKIGSYWEHEGNIHEDSQTIVENLSYARIKYLDNDYETEIEYKKLEGDDLESKCN